MVCARLLTLCHHCSTLCIRIRRLTAECEYLFEWKTQYACPLGAPPPKSDLAQGCNVMNDEGQKIDLSPLARPFDNWVVEGGDRIYSIAVCKFKLKDAMLPFLFFSFLFFGHGWCLVL